MQKEQIVENCALNEELADTLIAISVIAKRLAQKLRAENQKEGATSNEQNE